MIVAQHRSNTSNKCSSIVHLPARAIVISKLPSFFSSLADLPSSAQRLGERDLGSKYRKSPLSASMADCLIDIGIVYLRVILCDLRFLIHGWFRGRKKSLALFLTATPIPL